MRFAFLVAVASLSFGAAASPAAASCGSASCPVDTLSGEARGRRWARIAYEFEFIDQDRPLAGGRRASAGEIPGHHDELYTVNRVHRLALSSGLTDRLSADLQFPLVARSHQHLDHDEGGDRLETWGFSGLGDLWLQARYAIALPEPDSSGTASLIGGVKFPTGRARALNADGAAAETGILPGSGSYDGLVGASYQRELPAPSWAARSAVPAFCSVSYRINGRGERRYRLGNALAANAGAALPVSGRLSLLAQANLQARESDDRGDTEEETDKTGGEAFYLSPGLEWDLGGGWQAMGLVQLPVYRRVSRIQLVADYNLLAGLSHRFFW